MRILIRAAIAAGAISLPIAGAAAQCVLDVGAPPQVRFTGEDGSGYNSFARSRFETDFTITIRNQDESNPCEGILSLQHALGDEGLRGSGGENLDYQISLPGSASSIIDPETSVGRPLHAVPVTLAAGQTVARPLSLHIPPGQSVGSGSYEDTLWVRLLDADTLKMVAEQSLQVRTIVVQQAAILLYDGAIASPSSVDMGTSNRQLDFGVLEEGEQASVTVLVQANDSYSLRFSSPHRGALWHAVEGASESIDYAAYFGGREINLDSGEHLIVGRPATGISGVAQALQVRIGQIGLARAGRYEDQIVVTVLPDS